MNRYLLSILVSALAGSTSADDSKIAPLIPQSGWSAEGTKPVPDRMTKHSGGITSIVIHHTESPNQPPVMEKARLVGIQRYHIIEKEWGDIAYHYLIGPSGSLYEGRDWRYRGDSGTSYDLDGRLLICLVGNFMEQLPESAALKTLVETIAAKLHEHGLKPEDVVTHRMVASTDCPGDRLQAWFEGAGGEAIKKCFAGETYEATGAMSPQPSGLRIPEGFKAIPPLAIPPPHTEGAAALLNQRFRSPDGTCEFGVAVVKVGTLGKEGQDRLITWGPIMDGEKETSAHSNADAPVDNLVTERFGITGVGDAYTRYFQRTYSTKDGEDALAVLWELMVRDSGGLDRWREVYAGFKASLDLSAL